MIEGLELAREASRLASNKKAEDIRIIDLRGISSIVDYFVVCSGTSMPHLKAIRKEVKEELKTVQEVIPQYSDGNAESQWMVLDYGDVMVHVFHEEARRHYSLEDLWSDAETTVYEPAEAVASN